MLTPYNLAKIGKFLIYVTLFIPFAVIPFMLFEFVFAKNLLFYFLSTIILFLGLIYLYKNKHNIDFKVSGIFLFVAAFIAMRVISGIFGVDPHNSFFGSQIRMDGNLGYLMLFGWFFALFLFFNKKDWIKFFKLSTEISIAVLIFAIVQAFFSQEIYTLGGKGDMPFWGHRITGSFGNSILLAGYFLPHIFISLYLFVEEKIKKYKYFWGFSAFALVMGVLFTQTRGAIISLAVSVVFTVAVLLIFLIKNKKEFFKKAALFGLPGIVLLFFVIINTDLFGRLIDFSFTSGTVATRLILWKIGFLGFLDKWILGWGPENFSYIFSKFYEPQLLNFSFYETWADKPHNQLIEIAATQGILGIFCFFGIIITAFIYLCRLLKKNKALIFLAGAIIAYLVHNFFAFDEIASRLIFFAILAYIAFLSFKNSERNYKISASVLKFFVFFILIIELFSLKSIGIKTLKASFYAQEININIINNKYIKVKRAFKNLKDIETPYENGNWEALADFVLKANAMGTMPKTTMVDIIPIMLTGLEGVVEDSNENFSYNYRLGQMYNLAGGYIDKKYFNNAIESLDKAKNVSPERQVSDLLLAHIYYSQKNIEKGIELLEDMINKNPDIVEPYWFLGILFDASGEHDKAYAYMTTATQNGYHPDKINEKLLYISVLNRFGDFYKMEPVYEDIIEKDKENPRWWANIATVYFENEKYEKAREAARQAMFLDSRYADEAEDFIRKIEKEIGN